MKENTEKSRPLHKPLIPKRYKFLERTKDNHRAARPAWNDCCVWHPQRGARESQRIVVGGNGGGGGGGGGGGFTWQAWIRLPWRRQGYTRAVVQRTLRRENSRGLSSLSPLTSLSRILRSLAVISESRGEREIRSSLFRRGKRAPLRTACCSRWMALNRTCGDLGLRARASFNGRKVRLLIAFFQRIFKES